ncbi:MAG: OmpH family outer membrane protein, partial [Gemmatimonadales bacterium]
MMLHRAIALITAAAVLAVPFTARRADAQICKDSRVAFVSMQTVLGSIPKYVQADSQLANEQNAYTLELQQGRARLDSLGQEYADKATLLSAAQKGVEQKKLQNQGDSLQRRAQELQQKLQDDRTQLMTPMENKVQQILDGLRAEQNCAMIFDVSSQTGIASADQSLNLTPLLVDRLRKSGDIPPAAGSAAPVPAPATKPPAESAPEVR